MDGMRQWAFTACAAMTVCAAAGLLIPEGSLRKTFSVTISIFFLCCILSPAVIKNPGLAVEIQEPSIEDVERRAELLREITASQTETAAAAGVKKIIAQKLDAMGINYTGIAINISTNIPRGAINGETSFDIESADITLSREHEARHEIIRGALERDLGFKVRLGYTDMEKTS